MGIGERISLRRLKKKIGALEESPDFFTLNDGVAEPDATLSDGIAYIYIDTADGDLKVKFNDGVIKTLATDT